MPVLVNYKFELECNSRKYSTNKTKTVVVDSSRIAKRYLSNKVIVLRPIIDNMVIRYYFQDFPKNEHEDLEQMIKSYLVLHVKTTPSQYSDISLYDAKKSKYRGFSQNIYFTHKSSGATTLIQACPKKDKNGETKRPFLKIWLNPDEIGEKGMQEVRQLILDMTVQTLTLDQILSHKKCIERMDIAIDILGIAPEDLEIRGDLRDPKKVMQVNSKTGRKQTYYVDYKPGTSTRTYLYDKRAERLDSGQKPLYNGVQHTRVEHRVETTLAANQLLKLKNHFKKIDIWAMDYSALKCNGDHLYIFAIDYILRRTLQKAKQIFPAAASKVKCSQAYYKARRNIWEPEALWDKNWHKVLKKSGLLPMNND